MTETPRNMDDVPAEEHIDSADAEAEKVGPDENSETRPD